MHIYVAVGGFERSEGKEVCVMELSPHPPPCVVQSGDLAGEKGVSLSLSLPPSSRRCVANDVLSPALLPLLAFKFLSHNDRNVIPRSSKKGLGGENYKMLAVRISNLVNKR